MLHSNPGDYAWGQSGLDAIVTQVGHVAGAQTQVCASWLLFPSAPMAFRFFGSAFSVDTPSGIPLLLH